MSPSRVSHWSRKWSLDYSFKLLFNSSDSPINSDFIFQCWNLPKDLDKLKPLMEGGQRDFIVKPSDSGEGHGIFITRNFTELTSDDKTNFVVQPLLTDPLLVEGRKVDLRTYVLVTSVLPLRYYGTHVTCILKYMINKYFMYTHYI